MPTTRAQSRRAASRTSPGSSIFDKLPDDVLRAVLQLVIANPSLTNVNLSMDRVDVKTGDSSWFPYPARGDARDEASGKAARLACRRFANLLDDEFWSFWVIRALDASISRRIALLNPTRCARVKHIRLAIEEEDDKSEHRYDPDEFGGLGEAKPMKEYSDDHRAAVDTLEIFLKGHTFPNLVRLDFTFMHARMYSPIMFCFSRWLESLQAGSLPRLDAVQISARPAMYAGGSVLVPSTSLAALFAAAPNITELDLQSVQSYDVLDLVPRFASPLKLRRFTAAVVAFDGPMTEYLAASLDSVKEVSLQAVRPASFEGRPLRQIFEAASRSRHLLAMAVDYYNDEDDIDVQVIEPSRPDLRFLVEGGGWEDMSGAWERQLIFVHRYDAKTIIPRRSIPFSAGAWLRHLQAGNAPQVRHLDLELASFYWFQVIGVPRETRKAITQYCTEHDIELLFVRYRLVALTIAG